MSVTENDLALLEAFEQRGYDNGGFKIYDVSDPARPKLICYHKTGGIGVHRFDMDERHAYISTEMKGYVGNILVIYDLRDPRRPQEVSRWWMPGQHVEGGETPSWSGRRHRLHHALRFRDEMWASCWHAGFWVVDVSDLARPKGAGTYNYHPLFPEPTHTVRPVPVTLDGRRIALSIDEEDQAQSASEEAARRGRAHACILTFDVTEPGAIKPLAQFQVSDLDSPFSRTPGARFGAHQFADGARRSFLLSQARRGPGTVCHLHPAGRCGEGRSIDRSQPDEPGRDRDHRLVEHKIHRFEYSLEHQKRHHNGITVEAFSIEPHQPRRRYQKWCGNGEGHDSDQNQHTTLEIRAFH